MKKSDELKRFETDLRMDPELNQRMDAACKRIMEEGRAQSDAELIVKAAEELGYAITAGDLERDAAAKREFDPDELAAASGGEAHGECISDWRCMLVENQEGQDEFGHNQWCVTAWHCSAVTLHTDTESQNVSCWSNYKCGFVYQDTTIGPDGVDPDPSRRS